jgi:hypothetical protein
MQQTTVFSATTQYQPWLPVDKDWPLVMNHLRTLTELPRTPETSNAQGQSFFTITGSTHSGLPGQKRIPKSQAPAGNKNPKPNGKGAGKAK